MKTEIMLRTVSLHTLLLSHQESRTPYNYHVRTRTHISAVMPVLSCIAFSVCPVSLSSCHAFLIALLLSFLTTKIKNFPFEWRFLLFFEAVN
jgi:hypothetical protein